MGKEALHELVEQVKDSEIEIVYFILSRVIQPKTFEDMIFEEVEPLPDELEIIKEAEEDKARGEKLISHEEVWGVKTEQTHVA